MSKTVFNLMEPAQVRDAKLFPAVAELHRSEPVFWSDAMQGWVLCGHEVVDAAFKDRRISNKRVAEFAFRAIPPERWEKEIPHLLGGVENWIVNLDAPRHARVRSLVMKAFSKRFVESLSPRIERYCAEAIETALDKREFDFMSEIVFPVPAKIILNFLGLSEEYLSRLRDWNHRVNITVQAAASAEILRDGDRAVREMNEAIRGEIEERRASPRDDFLSTLIQATEDGERLSLEELFSVCQVLLIAGQDTTVNSICLGTLAFLEHPDQLRAFLDGDVDPITAMNEVTRFTSMSTCQYKIVAQDFELAGKQLRAGDIVFIMIGAANRDPQVFDAPDTFDLRRDNLDRFVTFGPGIHLCIGHYLARLEMAAFFRYFFGNVERVEILDDPIRFQPNFVFRGLDGLNMRIIA